MNINKYATNVMLINFQFELKNNLDINKHHSAVKTVFKFIIILKSFYILLAFSSFLN